MEHQDLKHKATLRPYVRNYVFRPIKRSAETSHAGPEAKDEVRKKQDPLPIQRLLSREEVMEILGCGVTTMGKLKRQKKLVPVKIERLVRYKLEDVMAYIDSCCA